MWLIYGLGRVGATLALSVLSLMMFGAAVWAGAWTAERTGKDWQGWVAGIAALMLIFLLFGSTYGAVQRATCYHVEDFHACMDEDDE